jgi:hypothetical protein
MRRGVEFTSCRLPDTGIAGAKFPPPSRAVEVACLLSCCNQHVPDRGGWAGKMLEAARLVWVGAGMVRSPLIARYCQRSLSLGGA